MKMALITIILILSLVCLLCINVIRQTLGFSKLNKNMWRLEHFTINKEKIHNFLSYFFFITLFSFKFLTKPILTFINFSIFFLANLGDMLLAQRAAILILSFFFKKICYLFWYIKKYWLYKPVRFFYIYLFIYFLNLIPKNRDLGFEDTFFFRGYKLYTLKNSDLVRTYLFNKGKLRIFTPEGFSWEKQIWNNLKKTNLVDNEKFFLTNTSSKRHTTDISFFYNVWSKTKSGNFWFLNKNIVVNFPKDNNFAFGTEFQRIFKYKSWKHSYLNRLLYQAPYRKSTVAYRMLDYSFNFSENAFSFKNSFSYFFNFNNIYKYYPYKGLNEKLKVEGWSFSEKFLFNRDSQHGFIRKHIIRKSMPSYYSKISKLHSSLPYNTDYERSANLAKSVENFYSDRQNFFARRLSKSLLVSSEKNKHDFLTSRAQKSLYSILNKMSREFFLDSKKESSNNLSKISSLYSIWSKERIYNYQLHKYNSLKKDEAPGMWNSYFKNYSFYGRGPFASLINRKKEKYGDHVNKKRNLKKSELRKLIKKKKFSDITERGSFHEIGDNMLKNHYRSKEFKVPKFLILENYKPKSFKNRYRAESLDAKKDFYAYNKSKPNIFLLQNYLGKKKKINIKSSNEILNKESYLTEDSVYLDSYKPSSLMYWNNFLSSQDIHIHSKIISKIDSRNYSPFVNKNLKEFKNQISNHLHNKGIGHLDLYSKANVKKKNPYYFINPNPFDNAATLLLNGNPFGDNRVINTDNLAKRDFFKESGKSYKFSNLYEVVNDFKKRRKDVRKLIKNDRIQYTSYLSSTYPNYERLYGFMDNVESAPSDLERPQFMNNLFNQLTFVLDSKYLDNDYYYQVYPALFNQSNVDYIFTPEFEDSMKVNEKMEDTEEWRDDPFLELVESFEYPKNFYSFPDAQDISKSENQEDDSVEFYAYDFYPSKNKSYSNLSRLALQKEVEPDEVFLSKFRKVRQISQDYQKPNSKFYSDSVRYSNIMSLDFLKKKYREEDVLRNNSFFSSSNICYDISNYRLNHLYSKIFFEKNYRQLNFYNSRTDRSFFQKQKMNTLSFPSGKLKAPTKYDYYFVNKIGNRGFIDYKDSSKFLNENSFVNSIKFEESKFFSFIWNELPSNFIFVELKYFLIDFFHNKANFLSTNICFTFTRILLSISDRILYEFISAIKIYVISWFSVLVDDIIGLYMRYYLIMLDHNTLLFISRKNVAYGSYTIVKTRDRSFERKRLFGLRDMRRRYYKGVGVNYLLKGSKMKDYDFTTDMYKFNTYRKKYTKIRGNNYGVYDKYLNRRNHSQSRKKRRLYLDNYQKKNKINRKYKAETKRSIRKLTDAMFFGNVGHKGSGYANRKAHAHPQNRNKRGFIVISRSKVSFKPGKSFRFGKFYMKFRFRPVMLRFSNSTYFFRYKNLSSSLFTEYNRFPKLRRKFFDFFKYSDLSFKSKNKNRNLKILPAKSLRRKIKDLYKSKRNFYRIYHFTGSEFKYYRNYHSTQNYEKLIKLRGGFKGDINKHFMVSSSYGINDFLMRYSVSFKCINTKNNFSLYNKNFYFNKDYFDNFFFVNVPVNYKLRFVKITDLLMVDFLKWKKHYVQGHSAWIGENARRYNLDFYKNSSLRTFKRHLKYNSKKLKIRQIPYKVNQRYSYSLYKNPFLKTKDSDFIKSLFLNKSLENIPYTSVVSTKGLSKRSKDVIKANFKSSKYLEFFINNLKKRKNSPLKVYFRTYNRNFYDFMRNFNTKRKPKYRVPLSYSYYKRRTLFFKRNKKYISRYIHNAYKFTRRVMASTNFNQFNNLFVKRFVSPIVSPFFLNTNKLFVNLKLNLNFMLNKLNLNFYSKEKKKDYDFSFFDIKEKFRFNFIKNVRTVKSNRRHRKPRRVVTFWNKNYFLKFRKIGYNNLNFRRSYKIRDNILKVRKWRNKYSSMNYFIFNPRFWNTKAYDTLLPGFYSGYLYGKGKRSRIRHYQITDLVRKKRKWKHWRYKLKSKKLKNKLTYILDSKLFRNIFNSNLSLFLNVKKIAYIKLRQKKNINIIKSMMGNYFKNIYIIEKSGIKNKSSNTLKKIIDFKLNYNISLGSYLRKKKFFNKVFLKKVIINFKIRSDILKSRTVPLFNLRFLKVMSSHFSKENEKAFLKFKRKVYFSFFYKKAFSFLEKNYKNSFLTSKFYGNFSRKKKAFLQIYDHLFYYKFELKYLVPNSYRYFIRKNKYFFFLKSYIQEAKFFYMSKFFFKYLNIYSDFLDFAARLKRESFFHKRFRKNLHTKFFFYRFLNRKNTNYILVDKNYNYLNLIFSRVFPTSQYKRQFNNDFVKFFLKYKRYRYNKHQYSRFRKPKYYSLLNTNYKYFDYVKEKKKYLIKTKNYSKNKKKAITKRMSKNYNLFLNRIWNVINFRRNKRKKLNKSGFMSKFLDLYYHSDLEMIPTKLLSNQFKRTLLNFELKKFIDKCSYYNTREKKSMKQFRNNRNDFFVSKFMKKLKQKDNKILIKDNVLLEFLDLCHKKRILINKKLKFIEKNRNLKYSPLIVEINNQLKKIQKKIVKDFQGLSLDYGTIAFIRDVLDDKNGYSKGLVDFGKRGFTGDAGLEKIYEDKKRPKKSQYTLDIFNKMSGGREARKKRIKNLRNSRISKRVYKKNRTTRDFAIDAKAKSTKYMRNKDTNKRSRSLLSNYNRKISPFVWRRYKKSSSNYKKTIRGFNQFFRRTFFNRRLNSNIQNQQNSLERTYRTNNWPKRKGINLKKKKKQEWDSFKNFMRKKNVKTDNFISQSYPKQTIKNKLWSKSKYKKQKIFILNFPKTKKYVGFQYLYNSRFSYNRGQKNYYRDRSLQNVVFDQNFKAQKFFEIIKERKTRKKKRKHIRYNRARNIRSAIFESRLKTRFWLRNKYYRRIKKKPAIFLDFKIPGTNLNLSQKLRLRSKLYHEIDYKALVKSRRLHKKKKRKKLLRKFSYIWKIRRIPRFKHLRRKRHNFGFSYTISPILTSSVRKGISYRIPYAYKKRIRKGSQNKVLSKFISMISLEAFAKDKEKMKVWSENQNNIILSDLKKKPSNFFKGASEKLLKTVLDKNETIKTSFIDISKKKHGKSQLQKHDKKRKKNITSFLYQKRSFKKHRKFGGRFGIHRKELKKRSRSKRRRFFSYRSNFGIRKKSNLLAFFYNLSSKNNLFLFPSRRFKHRAKARIQNKNYSFLNLNKNILKFFERYSKIQNFKKNGLLFFIKYKSFALNFVSNKDKKVKLAWYFLKSFQENILFNKFLLSQIEREKFGNFYIVDNKFTYGKKLNNYISKNNLYNLDFDLLYDSRRFKTRYYRRRIPFKTIVSAKSHYRNYKVSNNYDSVYTAPSKYLTYMFGYPSVNKPTKKYINNMNYDKLKRTIYFKNLFSIKEFVEKQNAIKFKEKEDSLEHFNNNESNLNKEKFEKIDYISSNNNSKKRNSKKDVLTGKKDLPLSSKKTNNYSSKKKEELKNKATLSGSPRLKMNYKREHFKHYYFYRSRRQKYGNKSIARLSKACIIRIDVLLILHVLRGFIYYTYRMFIVYLHSLKIFIMLGFILVFYKIFIFFWVKNVIPNLIFLRNIYFLSNNLIERRYLNTFGDFYKERSYKNSNLLLKKYSRIYKTDFFNKKNYYNKANSQFSYYYFNDRYFVRNFFFTYNEKYKKIFIKYWINGFFNTFKDTLFASLFLFLYFSYKLFILIFNLILNFLFKYILSEIILWFFHFFNVLIKRQNYYNYKKKNYAIFFWNIIFSFISFIFRKMIYMFFLTLKIFAYLFVFLLYSLFIFSYLKYYNLTLTELPSTVLILVLHAFLVFSLASISKNIKNLFVESNLNNIFPENIFTIGKEDNETALSPLFEMEHTYYPENHFIDYDKLIYSVAMDKALGTTSDQNPSNYYLGSHLSSNFTETNLSTFTSRFKVRFIRKIVNIINPLKKSFRDEDLFPSMNFVVNRNYVIPNEISQKINDSNPIKNFFYKSTIMPLMDIIRLTNIYNEKSTFLNFKQIYSLKFKFLKDYREFYKTNSKKSSSNLNEQLPSYIKNYWIQRVKLKRKNNINISDNNKTHFKLYEDKIYKINNFNFFTYKNYKIIPKITSPYRKYLVLIFLIQFREYNRVQKIYNDYLKDIYYPFSYQDGVLWDDLFDNFEFSNRTIWPSSDFGLFFQKKFREEIAFQNRVKEDIDFNSNKYSSNLMFLLRNRELRPDYKSVYKRYKNSWFLDYDKIEYVRDIDRFEESLKVFTTKEPSRIIAIFEDDEDETQSMIEEQHYLMDETDLSVYYDDHIFSVEDSSLFDFESIAVYNLFLNKLNLDLINSKRTNMFLKRKAFEKVFIEEYENSKKLVKKSNFSFNINYMNEKFDFLKKNKEKISKKVYKEYLLSKKNFNYDLYHKKLINSNFKYKFLVNNSILKNTSRMKNYKTKLFFGIESGSFLFRGSFLDPRVSPKRLHNILKYTNDIEFQDNNWFKSLIEKRILVDTSYNKENYLFKNNVSTSDIDSILFCDVRNNESALGRLSEYGAHSFWDDHVWITSSSEFRSAVTEFLLNMEKKYKLQYDIGIFNKNRSNKPLSLNLKKYSMENNKKKVSRLHYFKKDPLESILSKKTSDDKVHSLDFEKYRNKGQFLDFPTDFEALNKQVSFIPITQIVSINDIKISHFKIWFKEIMWYQIYDNRFKRAFFEDFLNICEFLDLRHFPVLNLEESERLWSYLGCTEEEWDFVELEPTNITVPFSSDEIVFFFLLVYFINSVPTTNSVGHSRTLYALEDSSKIVVYYRNFTFYKMYDFFRDFFRLFVMSIHWSKDFLDFLNLYKHPLERITGTYTTYPYIPYNKFFNPFRKYWFNPQILDFETNWFYQSHLINYNRNEYPQIVIPKISNKISWIDFQDDLKKHINNLNTYNSYTLSLPLYRLGPVRNYTMLRKNSVYFSNNSSEIGWNDRGFGMSYFARYNSLWNLPQNKYTINYKLPLNFKNIFKVKLDKNRTLISPKKITINGFNFTEKFVTALNYIDIAHKKFWGYGRGIVYPKNFRPFYDFTFGTAKPFIEVSLTVIQKGIVRLKEFNDNYIYINISNIVGYYTRNLKKVINDLNNIQKHTVIYNDVYDNSIKFNIKELFNLDYFKKAIEDDTSFRDLNENLSNYLNFFFLKTNSRRYSLLDGFTSDFFLSKRPLMVRQRAKDMNYHFFGNFNLNVTNIYNKLDLNIAKWQKRHQNQLNKFFNLKVTPTNKKYTIASYFPEPLLHTPSTTLTVFRSRVLFNYDWFYAKCAITLILSLYFILSLFLSPLIFILINIANFFFVKFLWYLSFIFSDIFIIHFYNFVYFIIATFKVNYLLIIKLYFLLIFDFFYYFFDMYFLLYLFKLIIITNFLELLNIEYWISIFQFTFYCFYLIFINFLDFEFFNNFFYYINKCYFFFEHTLFLNTNYIFFFSSIFKNKIALFYILSSFFYYPYYVFPHLYISFVHFFMVFFHVFVNILFVEYFSVYILFIDIKPYFYLLFDFLEKYFNLENTILKIIYTTSSFFVQIILYLILVFSFLFFYFFYVVHMFFQFLSLFYVIFFFFT